MKIFKLFVLIMVTVVFFTFNAQNADAREISGKYKDLVFSVAVPDNWEKTVIPGQFNIISIWHKNISVGVGPENDFTFSGIRHLGDLSQEYLNQYVKLRTEIYRQRGDKYNIDMRDLYGVPSLFVEWQNTDGQCGVDYYFVINNDEYSALCFCRDTKSKNDMLSVINSIKIRRVN